MPFSQSSQLSTIVGFGEALQPTSILDVGTGMGQYGFLFRNNLESVGLFDVQGARGVQRPREQWRVRIDGIEGFAEYLTPVHAYAYTQVWVGDAIERLSSLPDRAYELVIAVDILEHFEHAQGELLLQHCARVCSRAALVSTPKEFIAQQVQANPLEDHRSLWTQQQLAAAGYTTTLANAESWVAVLQK